MFRILFDGFPRSCVIIENIDEECPKKRCKRDGVYCEVSSDKTSKHPTKISCT